MVKSIFAIFILVFSSCLLAQEDVKPKETKDPSVPSDKDVQQLVGKIARDGLFVPTAPFKYPDRFRIESQDLSGSSWRENVTVPGKYIDVKKMLSSNIKKCGYRLKHDIELAKEPASSLMAWEKTDKVLVVMIFDAAEGEVCFSWGYFDE